MTVAEYERIGGMLDDDRVELIDGYLVKKMSKNPPHIVHQDDPQDLGRDVTARVDVAEGRSGADPGLRRARAGYRDPSGFR